MGKVYERLINRFDGGFSNDLRSKDFSKYAITKHFDAFTYPHKLVPYHSTEADEVKSYFITKFLYASSNYSTNTTFKMFGYGVVSGDTINGKVAIYEYAIDSGLDQTWTLSTNGSSASGSRERTVFFYYKGYIYGWKGSNTIWRFDTDGGDVFNDSYQTIAFATVCQPVHHPSDDIAYFFSDYNVHTLNNTTWTSNALVLPNDLKITAACAYGNFLAIGCTTLGNSKKRSIIYLWDRDSSLTTMSERIDFGEGEVKHLAVLNNKLIGVIDYYTASSLSLNRPQVIVKQGSGSSAATLNRVTLSATVSGSALFSFNQSFVENNRLYFPMRATLGSDARMGVWVIDEYGNMTIEFQEEEATEYEGIFKAGEMWFISHSGDGSTNRSDDNLAYSTTLPSVYETLIEDSGDCLKRKKPVVIRVYCEPLPTAGQIVLKYRKDEETSYTTIFTLTTDNSLGHSTVNIESSGANLPEHKEIQYRVESTGGAVVTGLYYKHEILDTEPA